MSIPYRHIEKITINQQSTLASARDLASCDGLLLLLPSQPSGVNWEKFAHGAFLAQRARQRRGARKDPSSWSSELPNPRGTQVYVVYCDAEQTPFQRLSTARDWAQRLLATKPSRLALLATPGPATQGGLQAVLLALLAASCPLPQQKRDPDPAPSLRRIDCYGVQTPLPLARLRAYIQGNHVARWLTALPGNRLGPAQYRRLIATLAKAHNWTLEFLDQRALRRRRAGAFLAVTQAGSPDSGIVQLKYRPRGHSKQPKLALVGKGISFDTGGVNLKSAKSMYGMHEDMAGSAVALGSLLALSQLKVDFAIDCWLALAENNIGPAAYKPNDVVTACDGSSIEIVHTDAEGRMVLADTLSLCAREKPDVIIDYATLTGSCVDALSTRYSGLFCNRDNLLPLLVAAGRESGERVWPFPLDSDYDEDLKSDCADIKQCTVGSEADHILAARFLARFVPASCAWVHLDLAAANHKGGLAHIPSDITGFGVGLTLQALLEAKLLAAAVGGTGSS